MNKPDSAAQRVQAALSLDGSLDSIDKLYENWAGDYDQDLAREQYSAPQTTANLALELIQAGSVGAAATGQAVRVLDAGCGTGLVGPHLARHGNIDLVGFDLSQAMVDEAAKLGVYRRLWGHIDLNAPLVEQIGESGFDLALACGVFTLGHVPPQSISRMLEIVRPGGVVLVSARNSYCEQTGFNEHCELLVEQGVARKLLHQTAPYIEAEQAQYWALAKA